MDVALLAASEADSDFVYEVNREAMREYVERVWGRWNLNEQRSLHDAGFNVSGGWFVIADAGDRVGVLQYSLDSDELWLGRITLLPHYQGRGIGSRVLDRLRSEHPDKLIRLRVLEVNRRAQSLYERLGFRTVRVEQPHVYMEALPRS